MKKKPTKEEKTVVRAFRLPTELWQKLMDAAKANRRTTTAQLVLCVEEHKEIK